MTTDSGMPFARSSARWMLASDAELAEPAGRLARQDEIDAHITAWTLQQTPDQAMHTLQQAGVPAGAVMNQADAYADPHLKERQFFKEAWQADCGTHLYPGPLYQMSKTPLGIHRGPGNARPGQRICVPRVAGL